MPPELAARIQRDVAKDVALPELRTRLTEMGVDIVARTPAEFDAFLRTEVVRYSKIIEDANIKPG